MKRTAQRDWFEVERKLSRYFEGILLAENNIRAQESRPERMQAASKIISALCGGERSSSMRVQGMVDPGKFSVEQIPGTNRSLVRLFQNVSPIKTEDFTGFAYDEYHVEVETWDGLVKNVQDNYEEFLKKGKDNEIDRSNEILHQTLNDTGIAVRDADAMNIDQEYRLTMLELGLAV